MVRDVLDERANPRGSDWQQRETQQQLSDAEAAALAEQARLEAAQQTAQQKQKERDAAFVRLFDQDIDGWNF